METNEFKTTSSYFNFRELMQKLRNIFEPMARQKNLFFTMTVDDSVPEKVLQDEPRLGQILVNIIGNAVKYTFTGQVKIKAELVERSGYKYLQIIVKDTGRGIENID